MHKPLSEEAKELIQLILERDPEKRLGISEIREHRWMKVQESGELFTESERTYIHHEFTYNETNRLNRNE